MSPEAGPDGRTSLRSGSVSAAGVDLAYIEAGDPERETIVLVHGYPDDKSLWAPVIERLADRFHVVAYDVRGAGESSAPRGPWSYGYGQLAGDLEAIAAAISPERPVHLAGHDWGAIQGWELAARLPQRVASFTAIAGPALGHARLSMARALRRGRALHALGQLRHSWYVLALCLPGGPTIAWRAVLGRGVWPAYLRYFERITPPVSDPRRLIHNGTHGANLYRRHILLGLRGQRPPHLTMPVQLVVPSGDHWVPPGYYEAAQTTVPALRRRQLAGSHWAPLSQPELISRWIGEHVADSSKREAAAHEPASGPWIRGGGLGQLRGRLALVTGAGSGIGRALAGALTAHGTRVLLVDRDAAAVRRAAGELGALALTCDVTDPAAMEELRDRVLADHGTPDVVVNNAGIGIAGAFLDTGIDDWRRLLGVNLMGVIHGCRLFGQALVERGLGGQIVNTASAAAFWPSKDLPAYSTSKAAVLMLSECLRAELAPSGIGVTAVCPGIVATNITATTQYVGRAGGEQERLRDQVTRLYQRRNFTPERVAQEVLDAIATDRAVAVVTPEAKAMQLLSRFAPGVARRLAGLDALPA